MAADTVSDRSPLELCQQVCEELRQRLRTGQPCQAETFLSAHPLLSTNPELAVELIVAEFQVRRELGENLNPLEWFDRFPQYRDQLASAFESHHLLSATPSVGVSTGVNTVAYADTLESIDLDGPIPELQQHEKHEVLGRGAMGVVYRARDKVLNRVIALKTIQSGLLAGPMEVRRFYREAQAAARLHHPNIVPIYHMGLFEGQHSYTMRLVKGGTLGQRLRKYKDDFRGAAALMEKVARGVHAAHVAGIIHRDLKPANIMLDENSEPLVADFGLARLGDGPSDISVAGRILGTPAYMSPEQASARHSQITPRSDVWSLGVILYEMLAGQRPFDGKSREDVCEQVIHSEPTPLRHVNPQVPRELEVIVMKCLEKDTERRYQTAEALAEDLGRWLRGDSVSRPSLPHVVWKGLRGHSFLTAAILLLTSFAATAFFVLQETDPDRERKALATRLSKGEVVTLIGEKGGPVKVVWAEGEGGGAIPSLRGDESFTIQSFGRARLELLSDPLVSSYRLRAQVRHTDSQRTAGSFVGVYGLYKPTPTPNGIETFACECCFNDHDTTIPREAWLKLRRFRTNTTGGRENPSPLLRPPAKQGEPNHWFNLDLVVTPDRIQASLDGNVISTLSREDLPALARYLDDDDRPLAANSLSGFAIRGGLGLVVYKGAGSFRNVRIEPYNDQLFSAKRIQDQRWSAYRLLFPFSHQE